MTASLNTMMQNLTTRTLTTCKSHSFEKKLAMTYMILNRYKLAQNKLQAWEVYLWEDPSGTIPDEKLQLSFTDQAFFVSTDDGMDVVACWPWADLKELNGSVSTKEGDLEMITMNIATVSDVLKLQCWDCNTICNEFRKMMDKAKGSPRATKVRRPEVRTHNHSVISNKPFFN